MSLLGGMKDRLGFGGKPEWADDDAEYYDDDVMYDDEYDDYADPGVDDRRSNVTSSRNRNEVIAFDSYNPNNFEHVTLSTDRKPRVASYDSLDATPRSARSYSRSSSSSSYNRGVGGTSRRDSNRAVGEPTWSAPEDPSFLDSTAPARSRNVGTRDAHSSLGSDFLKIKGDPAGRMEVIYPTVYADIEKVANAAKAGKIVILNVVDTKASLAKRILDFSFGVASALNLNVGKAADRVFVISKSSEPLSDEDRGFLIAQGVLKVEPEA